MAKYRVEFEYIEVDGTKREDKMTVPLSTAARHKLEPDRHGHLMEVDGLEGPWIIEGQPFEGELEDWEVAQLKSRPGVYYSPAWRFTVTEVN